DVEVVDHFETERFFEGVVILDGRHSTFRIRAVDWPVDRELHGALVKAGGPTLQIYTQVSALRNAISQLTHEAGVVTQRLTTDFGWTTRGDAYLVPGGRITAEGFQPVTGAGDCNVDLSHEPYAQWLDMRPAASERELQDLKRHVAQDLLQLHEPR